MDGFRYLSVTIKGLAPGLLMSNGQMSDPANWYALRLAELRNKLAAGEEVERQRVRYSVTGRLYVAQDTKQIVVPGEMLASALRKGATSISTKNGRKWWAGITVMADAPLVVDGLPAWDALYEDDRFVHRCMARGGDGTPQPRYRPYFRQWSATLPVEIDTSAIDTATLTAVFKATGRNVGLGDWRPSSPKNPGKYGRFEVVGVNEASDELPKAA